MDAWRDAQIDTAVESFPYGKESIAGRRQTPLHFMLPFLWANSTITLLSHMHTLGFCNLKGMSRRDACKLHGQITGQARASLN